MSSLQNKVTRGVLWSTVDVVLRQGIQFLTLVILARLLSPDDFGVLALLGLLVGVANAFVDGGFGSALIQRQTTRLVEESTVFFFNLAMGFVVALVLCAMAPWIARSFDNPGLTDLVDIMALNVLINTIGSIHSTLLTKALRFELLAKIGGIASLISGSTAIALALEGFGVWSLVIQVVLSSSLSTLLLWRWHAWRPMWAFDYPSLKTFFRFGGYLMIIAIIDTLHTNLYSLLIGKFYNVRDVGFYDRAQKTQLLPVNLIMSVSNRVAFSAFSSLADDKPRLAQAFGKAQRCVMYLNLPLSVFMIVLAEPIILSLFGEVWLPSVPLLQVLGFAGMLWPMHILNINVLKSQGRSDLYFNIMLVKKTIAIGLTIVGSFYGIMAIAWAQVVSSVLSLMINAYYSKKLLDYGLFRQLLDLLPVSLLTMLTGLLVWVAFDSWHFVYYFELIYVASMGATFYLLASYLFRLDAFFEMLQFVPQRQHKGAKR